MNAQNDLSHFFRALMRNPKRISAMAPSSQMLADAMVAQIPINAQKIVELGPGTGVFTLRMLEAGIPSDGLRLVELDPHLTDLLRQRFPDLHISCGRAEDLREFVSGPVDAVVSGLPLLSFSEAGQQAILESAFALLRPSAPFIQFTYGASLPVRSRVLRGLGLVGTKAPRTWCNLPPATVYVLRRRLVKTGGNQQA